MAKQNALKELRDKENGHLEHELTDKLKHMFDLRSQAVTEKLEDPSQLRKTKKEIAQIKTILRQRQIEQQQKQTASAGAAK
jgi:large subunit ribosomal protein L29